MSRTRADSKVPFLGVGVAFRLKSATLVVRATGEKTPLSTGTGLVCWHRDAATLWVILLHQRSETGDSSS